MNGICFIKGGCVSDTGCHKRHQLCVSRYNNANLEEPISGDFFLSPFEMMLKSTLFTNVCVFFCFFFKCTSMNNCHLSCGLNTLKDPASTGPKISSMFVV